MTGDAGYRPTICAVHLELCWTAYDDGHACPASRLSKVSVLHRFVCLPFLCTLTLPIQYTRFFFLLPFVNTDALHS